jgi:hypothetical protein
MRVGEGEPDLAEQPRLTHVQPPALPISRDGGREIAKDQALTGSL